MELNDLVLKSFRYDLVVVVLVLFCGGEMEEEEEEKEEERKHRWTEMRKKYDFPILIVCCLGYSCTYLRNTLWTVAIQQQNYTS